MNVLVHIILIIIAVAVFAFWLFLFIKSIKYQKNKKEGLEKYSAIYAGIIKHIEGLSIATGSMIEFYYGKKKITFKKDNQEILLECDKITSMDLVLGQDIKSQAATGAIAGKFILGGLGGAMVGAMLATTFYFIIIYSKENENKTIILDSTGSDLPFKKILNDFKNSHLKETKKIEL